MLKVLTRRVLGAAGNLLRGTRVIGEHFGIHAPAELRVLIFHDVPRHERAVLRSRLVSLQRSWRFVSPPDFADMICGRIPVTGGNLLATFDDGFASNRVVAEEVLQPLGIRAVFFVIPEFVDIQDPAHARRYISRRIQPGARVEHMDPDLTNMRWTDLAALSDAGHEIGAHTISHARVSTLEGQAERIREIITCGDEIESRIRRPVRHFAFPYGDLASVDDESVALAATRYEFLHFGIRGSNVGVSPRAIRRDAIVPHESTGVVNAFLGGLADPRYATARRMLDAWGMTETPRTAC